MLIDAHQHLWWPERGDYGWLTPDRVRLYRDFGPNEVGSALAAHGVQAGVVVQAAPTLAETRHLLAVAGDTPAVAAVVGWIDLEATDAVDTLTELARVPKFRGVRPMLQALPEDDWILKPSLRSAIDAVVDLDLSFDALIQPRHLTSMLRLVDRHPRLRVVVDHGAKPAIGRQAWGNWADALAELATRPNVHCKLSGLFNEMDRDQPVAEADRYVRHLIAAFVPERLMWGSDYPMLLESERSLDDWVRASRGWIAQLNEPAQARILGGTAADFYRIQGGWT